MTLATDVFTTAIGIDHTMKTRQTLQRHRASGRYDADAAARLLRNNARHACKVHRVARVTPELLDSVVRMLQIWVSDSDRE